VGIDAAVLTLIEITYLGGFAAQETTLHIGVLKGGTDLRKTGRAFALDCAAISIVFT
jgi:hypothetical protein